MITGNINISSFRSVVDDIELRIIINIRGLTIHNKYLNSWRQPPENVSEIFYLHFVNVINI